MNTTHTSTQAPCFDGKSKQRNTLVLISGIGSLDQQVRKHVHNEGWSICDINHSVYLPTLVTSLRPALIVTTTDSKLLEHLQNCHNVGISQSRHNTLSDMMKINIDRGFGLIYVNSRQTTYTLYRIDDTQASELTLCSQRQAFVKGESCIKLTNAEFSIMRLLAETKDKTVTKDQLSESALRRIAHPNDRSIDVHISRIRKKTSTILSKNIIQSVRGVGYRLICPITST